MKNSFSILVVALLAASAARGQEPSRVPVPHPSKNAHWTIQYRRDQEAAKPAEGEEDPGLGLLARSSDYQITGNIARHVLTLKNGAHQTIYIAGHYKLAFDAELKKVLIVDLERVDAEVPEQLFHQQYPGFEWVKPEFYEGEAQAGGQPCHHFRYPEEALAEATPADGDAAAARPAGRSLHAWEAWVSAETGLPVAYRQDGVTGIYHFAAPPAAPLTLPPDYLATLKNKVAKGPPPGQAASLARAKKKKP